MAGSKLTKDKVYDVFHTVPNNFDDTEYGEYRDVLELSDPVLRNISLYLIQHYKYAKVYCSFNKGCVLLCEIMNKWLNEKEAIYTSNGECQLNRKLWDKYIDNLWKKLEKSSEKPNWCQRRRDNYKENYPKDWIPKTCNNSDSIDVSVSCSHDPEYKPLQFAPAGNLCSGSTISQFYGYVLFVVLLSSILLYKFSPLGTWLDNRIGNRNRIRENINSEAMEELSRTTAYTSPSSSKFNVIYHSLEN
ncbi:PIR Superfamily Protein [Plasmodium ovale curtisi]|uniref:PIR Superfamily Protein n=1 Tax=Plasmodium ovale curtisi TaxID=864141 RepID=A0A1A8XBY2_PLAOA|nr:PIR Superfamily Protein [Plasmodium ovale curtisi]